MYGFQIRHMNSLNLSYTKYVYMEKMFIGFQCNVCKTTVDKSISAGFTLELVICQLIWVTADANRKSKNGW